MTARHAAGLVDLHLHTTASDGRCTPGELVEHAAARGVSVMAVTDHDTTAGVADVQAAAHARGIQAVSGIEITAVENDRDIHVLGYFLDPAHAPLIAFLAAQRTSRIARVEAIAARLATLGMPIDVGHILQEARRQTGRSIGRPQVARAMVAAGHVADTREAFDRWLGHGGPAFVSRTGAPAAVVIDVIHQARGLASLAHPGKAHIDERIAPLREAGLDALEAYHPDHDAPATARYLQMARDLRLLLTGGSDFHGDPAHGLAPGSVTLPPAEWARLQEAHAAR